MARMELITRTERRRRWSAQQKAALLAEVEAEDGGVAAVATRHGIAESVLYGWRAKQREAAAGAGARVPPSFVPIGMFTCAADGGPAMTTMGEMPLSPGPGQRPRAVSNLSERPGVMEIELACGTRLRIDAFVNERALGRALRALKGLA